MSLPHRPQDKYDGPVPMPPDTLNRILEFLAARTVRECNHAGAGMNYPCCDVCWETSRTILACKLETKLPTEDIGNES